MDKRLDRRTLLRTSLGAVVAAGAGSWIVGSRSLAGAAVPIPDIIDCAGWMARDPNGTISYSAGTTTKIIVHHMVWPNTDDYSRERAILTAQECQDLHMDNNGWVDTGQHFTVSRGGYVLEGRHGSLDSLRAGDRQPVSAHCVGENTRAIGIENEGTYVTETPTTQLLEALTALCASICTQYGFGPNKIFGHWDHNNTQCPGAAFYPLFPQLRRGVAAAMEGAGAIPARTWPDIWESNAGQTTRAAQYLLRHHGYRVDVDGAFGKKLTKQVRAFQKAQGIDASGSVTDETWDALVVDLGPGATGDPVSAIQFVLNNKGLAVQATGTYDDATGAAVSQMQQLHGLPASGTVDLATWCATMGGVVAQEFAA